MLFLKLIQQLVKALNSEGTPGQVAAGIALGAVCASRRYSTCTR